MGELASVYARDVAQIKEKVTAEKKPPVHFSPTKHSFTYKQPITYNANEHSTYKRSH